MGYDVSYHPIDVALVHERVLPYVLGKTPDDGIDDLLSDVVRIRRIRWRAKAWALGARSRMNVEERFRYLWGRPLFTTAGSAEAVTDDVLRYLRMSTEDEVDPVARRMIEALGPDRPPTRPADPGHHPGSDLSVRDEVGFRIHTLRAAVEALRAGEDVVSGLPGTAEPDTLLAYNSVFWIVDFVAQLTPGWMNRGHVWPTLLAEAAELGMPPGFGTPEPLIAPLMTEFPTLDWFLLDTFEGNHMVGGYVGPADVPAVREWFAAHRDRIVAVAPSEKSAGGVSVACDEEDVARALTKIDEALAFSARVGFGFCEATEIYSGLLGATN